MNREETLALWKQGKEAWNTWAEGMLAQRKKLEDAGEWSNAKEDWRKAARASFENAHFEESVGFDKMIFPGPSSFDSATFSKDAWFTNTNFLDDVSFSEASFKEDAWFFYPGLLGTSFSGDVFFDGALFTGVAELSECKFDGKAFFIKTVFSGPTSFLEAKFSGIALFEKARFLDGVQFTKAHLKDSAVFTRAEFGDNTEFEKVRFEGLAKFLKVSFRGKLEFDGAIFNSDVWLSEANMNGDTSFLAVQFKGNAFIDKAKFSSNTLFDEAVFSSTARFSTCLFKGYTAFSNTTFKRDSDFEAINSDSAFTLEGAQFAQLPDFRQAHFTEAPSLDSMKLLPSVEPAGFWRSIFHPVSLDVISKYRTLKRLAIQGHDHEQEQIFFRGELRARRGTLDRIWHWRWWFGIFYEVFSDFGRSLFRPLAGWFFTMTGFAFYYLSRHFALHNPAYSTDLWGWLGGAIKNLVSGQGASTPDLTCMSGKGEPLAAAIYLSMKKGLLALGWEQSEKLNQTYSCLYGVDVRQMAGGSVADLAPVIPYNVSFMAIPQTVLSAAFIFLFLLALRNQFRIR